MAKEQKFPGIVLSGNQAEEVWTGEIRQISAPISFKKRIGEDLYYMDQEFCYGILRVTKLINSEEGSTFEIEMVDRFDDFKPIHYPGEVDEVEDVSFMGETGSADIRGAPIPATEVEEEEPPTKVSEIQEMFVRKRGNRWCVVHSNPAQRGKIIKCFPNKSDADKMHKAIIISKIRRGKMGEKLQQINFLNELGDLSLLEECMFILSNPLEEDIGIIVKMDPPNKSTRDFFEGKVRSTFPVNLRDKVKFLWKKDYEIDNTCEPLFSLELRRKKKEKKVYQEINLMESYKLKIPEKSNTSDLDKFVEEL